MKPIDRPSGAPHAGMRFGEFVALIAALMAVNALGIDSMLPALPAIGSDLGITHENDRQWVISAYVLGFGVAQLIFGPLADRFGRKPVLVISMAIFAVVSFATGLATSFPMLIAARTLQGAAAASSRVLTVSIVRDCYSGRQMARVMSLSFVVFLAVPILAPSLGQLILFVAPWHWIFWFLGAFGAALAIWAAVRLPETLHPEYRRPIAPGSIAGTARVVLANRYSLGYTLAMAVLFGALMGFINSSQQIFFEVLHSPTLFPIIFASISGGMVFASLLNSRIVERLGTRRISHAALIGFTLISGLHTLVAANGHESLASFVLFQFAAMFCFGLVGANFGSMAMAPVGHIAGTASSVQGFISTIGGALIGLLIGQSFDGSTVPVAAGYLLVGIAAIVIVLFTEKGRLFRPQNA